MIDLLLAAALASSACAADPASTGSSEACIPQPADWRTTATEADRRRVREWRKAWEAALPQARTGYAAEVEREEVLLDPDAALTQPLPPPGDYHCRTLKLGTPTPDLLTYIAYPPFRCRIREENGRITFTKLTGSQRPIGRFFADNERRMIFLGTLQLGDETRAYQYGVDEERDLVGLLERVGDRRWRIVFPYPHYESLLDVIELTP